MTKTSEPRRQWLLALLLVVLACGCSDDSVQAAGAADASASADGVQQWLLPKRLREISGLTMLAGDRLLAVADEQAELVEIDWRAGSQVKRFQLGEPAVRADFEGLALLGDLLHLVDSDGVLWRFQEGADRAVVPFNRVDTGAGQRCEVEGLAADGNRLLLACKEPRQQALRDHVVVLAWDPVMARLGTLFAVPDEAVTVALGSKAFHPSGIAVVADEVWLLAARQGALARFSRTGTLLAALRLPGDHRHPQAEGLAVAGDGSVLVADEGGKKRARLARYSRGWQGLAEEVAGDD